MTSTTVEYDDRVAFAGYVSGKLAEFAVHAGVNAHVWNAPKMVMAGARVPSTIDATDHGAWKGAWHVIRPWVTAEFRQWIEEYECGRMTFTQWKDMATALREQDRTRVTEYAESADFCLDELRALRELQARRDEFIVTARERGATWAAIGEAIGMGRAQLSNIASRHAATIAAARAELATGVPNEWAPTADEIPF